MSEKPSWMPSEAEIVTAVGNSRHYSWTTTAGVRALVRATVEKALAEQERRHIRQIEIANDTYRNQEARHRREVIEAKIDALDDLWRATKRDDAGRTVEAAFASHVTPDFIRKEVARLASELAALDSEAK